MASQISGENRILVIGLGVSVVAALGLMRYMLIAFRDAAEIEQPAPKTQYIDQKTEDALMPSTLEKLISSHNKDIQGVASRIVLDRALHDVDTIGGLLWVVTSKDPERREKALRVLHLICGESSLADVYHHSVIKAIVTALKDLAMEIDYPLYDCEFDDFDFRDPAENVALMTLELLISDQSARYLAKTGFVEHWLARQNWGSTPEEIQKSFLCLYRLQADARRGNPLSNIVHKLAGQQLGVQKLVATGLIERPESIHVVGFNKGYSLYGDNREAPYWQTTGPSGDVVTYSLEEVLAATNNGTGEVARDSRRPVEQSAEERRLRRRNREVMVLHDGSQPLAMMDIIEL
ncbi:hypothetical protein VC83_04799 [Pseudogymnoascus destructans]|uniref:Cytoskeleton-associated protein n=2 Tax=Pseudogymnoascus destructans TaxID=655981 RepID=L8GCT2_PSED2|nr:uncharacterized protein VC83_04799 [Pseudogymnoascus destructans]ELR10503.1 hypothetical protein GMDG_04781 [Pseudogymnoascus destructans 20631-21]OAF57308.1 hypothetical protein VC83_04799 [Pseudogymnoascus destructans]